MSDARLTNDGMTGQRGRTGERSDELGEDFAARPAAIGRIATLSSNLPSYHSPPIAI